MHELQQLDDCNSYKLRPHSVAPEIAQKLGYLLALNSVLLQRPSCERLRWWGTLLFRVSSLFKLRAVCSVLVWKSGGPGVLLAFDLGHGAHLPVSLSE